METPETAGTFDIPEHETVINRHTVIQFGINHRNLDTAAANEKVPQLVQELRAMRSDEEFWGSLRITPSSIPVDYTAL